MITTEEDILFQLCVLHLVVFDEHVLSDCFNSVEFLLLDKLRKINFAKCSSAEQHFQLEIFVLYI
mgnify:CR=1 FL=1